MHLDAVYIRLYFAYMWPYQLVQYPRLSARLSCGCGTQTERERSVQQRDLQSRHSRVAEREYAASRCPLQ